MERRLLALTWLLAASGCAVDVCARAEAARVHFEHAAAPCQASGTFGPPPLDATQCKHALTACSSTDEAALLTWFDCVGALPACTPEARSTFDQAVLACAAGMNRLGDGCWAPSP